MNDISSKIANYKLYSVLLSLAWAVIVYAVVANIPVIIGIKIFVIMVGIIVFIAIGVYFRHKTASLKCHKCHKPILIKSNYLDETGILDTSYEKCHFCGEKIY